MFFLNWSLIYFSIFHGYIYVCIIYTHIYKTLLLTSTGLGLARIAGDLGLIPGLGRSPREGKGYPLQYSGLENSMDCVVPGVAKSQTQFREFLLMKSMEFGTEYIGSNFSSALNNCMIKASCFALVCSSAKWE